MRFGTRQPQGRAKVFFRVILVIPQFIVLYFVAIAALVVLFIGWFAALFTGRLPQSFADFLLGELRWRTRVTAYFYLLTDVYPPFTLSPDANYPVDIAVQTGRLNRLAVLFRYFLAIPGSIAVALVVTGMYVFSIVTWVATLIKGETPQAMFEANAATIRFSVRFAAYFYMLTSFYPSEVMGDESTGAIGSPPPSFGAPGPGSTGLPTAAAPPPPPPSDAPPPPPVEAPGALPSLGGFEPPAEQAPVIPGPAPTGAAAAPPPPPPPLSAPSGEFYAPSMGAVPQAPYGAAASLPVEPAADWRLVLSSGARKLVVAFFILGVLGIGAYVGVVIPALRGSTNSFDQRVTAQTQVFSAFGVLTTDNASGSETVVVQCLEGADARFGTALDDYSTTINSISFPSFVQSQVSGLQAAIASETQRVNGLSKAGSDPQAYESAVNSANLQGGFNQIETATQSLNSALISG
jgi:hypothetical protein